MTKQEFALRQVKRNKRIYTGCYYTYIVILAATMLLLILATLMKKDVVGALTPWGVFSLLLVALFLRPIKRMADREEPIIKELEEYFSGHVSMEQLSPRARAHLSQTSFSIGKLMLVGVLCLVMVITCGGGSGAFIWLLSTDPEASIGFILLSAIFIVFLIAAALLFLVLAIRYFADAVDAKRFNLNNR